MQVCEGEVGAIVLVVALLMAAVVGLLAVLPYAYAWLYSAVRGGRAGGMQGPGHRGAQLAKSPFSGLQYRRATPT